MELKDKDIIFVSNALANGGAARVICVLAAEFARRGHRVGIAAYGRYEGEYEIPDAVGKEYGPQGLGLLLKAKRVGWLRKVARRNPKAAIVAFEYFVNMQTILACWGLPNRLVISERNDPARVGNEIDGLRERLYRHADMLVCQTQDAANHFSNKVHKCVILNPLKEGLPDPWQGERRRVVVTFCRLESQKNLGMLLRAFEVFSNTHPDWALEIYGNGKEYGSLVAQTVKLGIAERVSINSGRPDVHSVVRDAGMFVLPSDYEGLSNSMLEAMAIGLPTICTDCPCGGARMVIRNGINGLLVPVGNKEELAEAMSKVASSSVFSSGLSMEASRIRDEFSTARIFSEWRSVIEC